MAQSVTPLRDNMSRQRKPHWLRVPPPTSKEFMQTRKMMRERGLNTVCEEAACPNIGECWQKKHATMMILGDICTRSCAFCNVKTGKPFAPDGNEPAKVADAIAQMGLSHVVITSVDRDDMEDGGADHWVQVVEAVRAANPDTTIEILTPDFRKKMGSVEKVARALPDVFNHNLETVPRLYNQIRPSARYYTSLRLLEHVKEITPQVFTKSGIMVGLGETHDEVVQVMDDMRAARVDFITIGQYLQPTPRHASMDRYVEPSEFEDYAAIARNKGFLLVSSTPLTRSSYHADADFAKLQAARRAKLSI